ncbi:MAG: HEAT repeat domain-containing protein, partial [Candidatus Sumerlaeota bacterium]|nr:HEAT repeat domain-containing protein [Candidatus Sumerlaeota bacterium]
ALGILGDEGTREDVIAALNDKNEEIRISAVWALTVLGGKKSVDVLSDALLSNKPERTPDPNGRYHIDASYYYVTRSVILKGLLALGDKSCLPAIKELQKNAEDYLFYGMDLNRTIELIEKP